MASLEKTSPKTLDVCVRLTWRRVGEFTMPYLASGLTEIVWSPVRGPGKSGLYRISISLPGDRSQAIYIGEGKNVARRLLAYTKKYGENQRKKTTELRISKHIRRALIEGRNVMVDAATTGRIRAAGADFPIRMTDDAQRLLAEAAAVVAESLIDKDEVIFMLNHVSDERHYLESD